MLQITITGRERGNIETVTFADSVSTCPPAETHGHQESGDGKGKNVKTIV